MKLKDIKGWPEKKDVSKYEEPAYWCGFNRCLDQLGNLEIVVDEEQLNYIIAPIIADGKYKSGYQLCQLIIKALTSSNIFKIKEEPNG